MYGQLMGYVSTQVDKGDNYYEIYTDTLVCGLYVVGLEDLGEVIPYRKLVVQ